MNEHWNELMNGFFHLPMHVLLSSCDRVKPLGQEHRKYPGLFSQPSLQPDIPSVHSLISAKIAIIIKEIAVVIIVYIFNSNIIYDQYYVAINEKECLSVNHN